ncbi:hypothetical protein [Neolewinella agarilytica]|uniref:Methyltransferase domain-containing protein n=1 Tax=Neolewinella agarilytica TaxID=478744 RepID=A0A1H9HDZ4_9BACT|nr:hypothetical protein [Neolewinella agarilytica]SEQ60550.1 hypothetical protein SAMN05444359_112122 [Neolewinella agarilytica]
MGKVEFNVPPSPYSPPHTIEFEANQEEYNIIRAFGRKVFEMGYFPYERTAEKRVLDIYRIGKLEALKVLLHQKPRLLGTLRDRNGSWPVGIYNLIDCFVGNTNPKRIFELNVEDSSWVVRRKRENIYGNIKDKNLEELFRDFLGISASLQVGDVTEINHQPYYRAVDLVIAFMSVYDTKNFPEILNNIEKLLSKEGRVLLFAGEALLNEDNKAVMEHIGIHLNTVLNFPTKVFSFEIGFSQNGNEHSSELMILSREKDKFIFTGQFANEAVHNEELLTNLFHRREPGRTPELGLLTHCRQYVSCLNTISKAKLKEESKSQRYPGVQLKELVKPSTAIMNETLNSHYTTNHGELLTAIFMHGTDLGLVNDEAVEEMLGEWQLSNMSVIKLPLDPTKVFYPYFRIYWESPLHQLALEGVPKSEDAFLGSVNSEDVETIVVYLPPYAEQVRRFELAEVIDRTQKESEQLKSSIWSGELSFNEFSARVEALQKGNDLSFWIARLPAPLARILNRYETTTDVKARSEHLYHFFEGCAEYIVCISLSFLKHSSLKYDEVIENFNFKEDQKSNKKFGATFGTWTHLISKIAITVRSLKEKGALPSTSFPQELTSLLLGSNFIKTIESARILRNKRSHEGLLDGQDAENRLKELEVLIQSIRYELVGALSPIALMYLFESRRKKGKYLIQFKDCRGASNRLSLRDFERSADLQDGLYLKLNELFIPLLPVIQYDDDLNIFTFFNALQRDEVAVVNYTHGEYSSHSFSDAKLVVTIRETLGLIT